MKRLMYLLLVVSLLSCNSHRVLYVYEDSQTNTYAVLELSKKHYNVKYKYTSDRLSYKYAEITGIKKFTGGIGVPTFLDLSVIDNNNKFDGCIDLEPPKSFIYGLDKKEKDKVILKNKGKVDCLSRYGISCFPPYMTKADKIDYSKFSEDIRPVIIAIDKGKSAKKAEKILAKAKNTSK